MVATNQNFVTPRDVARILFRHWRKMALFFCAVVGLTLVVIALYPRSYSSESKLFIRVGRESVALDPTATTGETITLQKSQADEINTALNILGSREVLQLAVERVGAARILEDLPSGDAGPADAEKPLGAIRQASDFVRSSINTALVAVRLSDPCSDEELAVRRLENGTTLSAPKESQVISISYSAASPELAHDVVDAITNVFVEQHLRLSQSEGSLEFFSEQVEKLRDELTAAQTELRDRKNEFQMTSSAGRPSVVEKSKEALRQKVYDLSMQESELHSRYTDAYPPLKEIRRQKQEAAEALMGLPSGSAVTSQSVAVSGELASELATLNDQKYQLAQLERNVELLEGTYRMHVEKLEQARINDALSRDKISNVKTAQQATLVRKPDSPNKRLVFALGLILATAGAIALAFLSEMLDQTLRTTDQIEAQLGLPVLLSLPRRKRNRRRPAVGAASTNGHAKVESNGHNGQQKHSGYRALVNELMASNGENGQKNGSRHARTVGVVGCDTSKLRSKVAGDLAIQAASASGDPVLLIDADARRRRVTKRFHINGSPGWREVLSGAVNADSCVHRQEVGNLSVMSPGTPNGHAPVERPATGAFGQLDGIKSGYGLVVVDLPPARDLESTPPASEWLDEMVLVVEAERTRIQTAQRAKDMLQRAGVRVTGVVLANRREHIPGWLYHRL
jgi:polysaccharide biosynthesis transport protein